MAKVSYTNLKIKTNTETNSFDFKENKIEVLKYLPMEEKYELVSAALDKAKDISTGLYNPILLDLYFHLYLVYMYTNISFTDKQKEDEIKLYDSLQSNKIIFLVIANIPEEEYNRLMDYCHKIIEDELKYKTTVAYLLNDLLGNIPQKIEGIQKMMDEIDQDKFKNAIDFAKSLNGGRDI